MNLWPAGQLEQLLVGDVAGVLTIAIPASIVLGALAAYLGYLKSRR